MKVEDLSPELQEKAKACKTKEELLALAEAEGIELSEDQLEAVAGGVIKCDVHGCPDYCNPHYFVVND